MSRHYANMRLNHGEITQPGSPTIRQLPETQLQSPVLIKTDIENNVPAYTNKPYIISGIKIPPDSTKKKQGLKPLGQISPPSIPAQQQSIYHFNKHKESPNADTVVLFVLGGAALLLIILITALLVAGTGDLLSGLLIVALLGMLLLIILLLIIIFIIAKENRVFTSRNREKKNKKSLRPLYVMALTNGILGIALVTVIGFFSTIFSVKAIVYGRQTMASGEFQKDQPQYKKARAGIILGKINMIGGFLAGLGLTIACFIALSGLEGIFILFTPILLIPVLLILCIYSYLCIKHVLV